MSLWHCHVRCFAFFCGKCKTVYVRYYCYSERLTYSNAILGDRKFDQAKGFCTITLHCRLAVFAPTAVAASTAPAAVVGYLLQILHYDALRSKCGQVCKITEGELLHFFEFCFCGFI
jgi:hypothetical protein